MEWPQPLPAGDRSRYSPRLKNIHGRALLKRRSIPRIPLPVALALMALLCLAGCSSRRESAPAATNLVLITLDTVRADHLGSYGYAAAETPWLDRLATEGVRFAQASVAVPLTLPSHSSLL